MKAHWPPGGRPGEKEAAADAATAEAVRQLLTTGYTMRDVGRLLGLSPQRISQIAAAVSKVGGKRVATA